ncbi:MAG: methyltransferase domain-containing protein [Defluviitaleaceae bacterium]|nr:methyltransferase domain-containing protein [Defluviitaleaceae bacterium]
MDDNSKIKSYYQDSYDEHGRMGRNHIEFVRSKEIISRYLSESPMDIADIGGATGSYSYWLASQGHNVHLLDFTPSHIDQAKEYGREHGVSLASYYCGDARNLPYEDNFFDIVLVMGPLYHLQDRDDRLMCLSEARRVLKPGGVLICALISRYASLLDGFGGMLINDEKFIEILDGGLETGMHSPKDTSYFTSAFFHKPSDIESELMESGFGDIDFIAIEGFARAVNTEGLLKNEEQLKLFLEYIRRTERAPELMGISDHFFAITRK